MAAMMQRHAFKQLFTTKLTRRHSPIMLDTKSYTQRLQRRPVNVYRSEEAEKRLSEKVRPQKWATRLGEKGRVINNPHEEYVVSEESESFPKKRDLKDVNVPYVYRMIREDESWFGAKIIQAKGKRNRRRVPHGDILLEGAKLINDAAVLNADIKQVFVDAAKKLTDLKIDPSSKTEFFKVPYSRMKALSDLKSTPGVFAIARIPLIPLTQEKRAPITLILDHVTDPGDLGTLLRTATVAGCHVVIAIKGCVDVWNNKVLRAGAGAHFRLPIIAAETWQFIGNYLPRDSHICLVQNFQKDKSNENDAVANIYSDSNERESETEFDEEDDVFKLSTGLNVDNTYSDKKVQSYENMTLPCTPIFDVDIGAKKHVTIVVSGAEGGASGHVKKLLFDHGGEDVFIPSADDHVATLNTAVTGCVMLMEAKRQIVHKQLMGVVDEDMGKQYALINAERQERAAEADAMQHGNHKKQRTQEFKDEYQPQTRTAGRKVPLQYDD